MASRAPGKDRRKSRSFFREVLALGVLTAVIVWIAGQADNILAPFSVTDTPQTEHSRTFRHPGRSGKKNAQEAETVRLNGLLAERQVVHVPGDGAAGIERCADEIRDSGWWTESMFPGSDRSSSWDHEIAEETGACLVRYEMSDARIRSKVVLITPAGDRRLLIMRMRILEDLNREDGEAPLLSKVEEPDGIDPPPGWRPILSIASVRPGNRATTWYQRRNDGAERSAREWRSSLISSGWKPEGEHQDSSPIYCFCRGAVFCTVWTGGDEKALWCSVEIREKASSHIGEG